MLHGHVLLHGAGPRPSSGSPVNQGTLVHPIGWGFRRSWYNPRLQQPDFIVTSDNWSLGWADVKRVAIKTYGPPVRTIQDGNLMALVWGTNLLPGLR
jgi:hypothetical protein